MIEKEQHTVVAFLQVFFFIWFNFISVKWPNYRYQLIKGSTLSLIGLYIWLSNHRRCPLVGCWTEAGWIGDRKRQEYIIPGIHYQVLCFWFPYSVWNSIFFLIVDSSYIVPDIWLLVSSLLFRHERDKPVIKLIITHFLFYKTSLYSINSSTCCMKWST